MSAPRSPCPSQGQANFTEPGVPGLARRDFLKSAVTLAATAALSPMPLPAEAKRSSAAFIDVNVSLFRWPARRLPDDETPALVRRLRSAGVTQAWAGSLDGVLHKDLAAVNHRLVVECRRHGRGLLLPFGSVNPTSPDWEEEFRRCVEVHKMPGIRLHPGYHGYSLDHPSFGRLLRLSAERGRVVQLVVVMEDERMMHPLLRVDPVDVTPLPGLARQTPALRLVLLNALRTVRGADLLQLVSAGEVHVEIAMLEGIGGVGNLLGQVPARKVLFGSHAPLFYFESAALKLKESPLAEEQRQAIRHGNAQRLLFSETLRQSSRQEPASGTHSHHVIAPVP